MELFSVWRHFGLLIFRRLIRFVNYKRMHNAMNSFCSVTEIVTSSPVGMQLTPLRYDALQGIFYRNVTWYPSRYQVGEQLFCFKALDSVGYAT